MRAPCFSGMPSKLRTYKFKVAEAVKAFELLKPRLNPEMLDAFRYQS